MFSKLVRFSTSKVTRHRFSTSGGSDRFGVGMLEPGLHAKPQPVQSRNVATKNAGVAVALLCFVSGVYYTAINKMRPERDELATVIAEEKLA